MTQNQRITFRVSPALAAALEQRAIREERPASQIIRFALQAYLKEEKDHARRKTR